MPTLEFLTFSGDPKIALRDEKLRRAIKSTATRSTRSSESQRVASHHESQSKATKKTTQQGGVRRFRFKSRHPPPAVSNALVALQQATSPSDSRLPFWDSIVRPLEGDAWKLLHYYRYYFRPNSWAINARKDWFTFVIEDQAATHATLSFVSLNRDLETGRVKSPMTLHHRMRAMQLVQTGIRKADPHLNDALIGAIALLAITEGLEGQTIASLTHVEALEKLIELRGGSLKIQHNEALLRLVAWAVLCRRPAIPYATDLSKLLESEEYLSVPTFELEGIPFASSFHESIYHVLDKPAQHLIRLLNLLPDYYPNDDTPSRQRQKTSRLIYLIEQQMRVTSTEALSPLADVLHSATHLYIYLVLRQIPHRTSFVQKRSFMLKSALDAVNNLSTGQYKFTEAFRLVILWATTIHYCSHLPNQGIKEEAFQLKQAMIMCEAFEYEKLVFNLRKIAWIGDFCESELLGLIEKLAYVRI